VQTVCRLFPYRKSALPIDGTFDLLLDAYEDLDAFRHLKLPDPTFFGAVGVSSRFMSA
jgi:hypothetical protein